MPNSDIYLYFSCIPVMIFVQSTDLYVRGLFLAIAYDNDKLISNIWTVYISLPAYKYMGITKAKNLHHGLKIFDPTIEVLHTALKQGLACYLYQSGASISQNWVKIPAKLSICQLYQTNQKF